MLAPFAAMEQRVNASVLARLANAVASAGAGEFPVLLDRTPADPFDGASAAASHAIGFAAAAAPALAEGSAITVDAVAYTVAGPIDIDATGWATARLYPSA